MTIYLNNQPNLSDGKVRLVQGDTLRIALTFKDNAGAVINLSAYTGKITIRKSPTLSGEVFATLLSTGGSPAITLAGTAPNFVALVSATTTATWEKGLYYYDLELTDGSGVKRTYLFNTFEIIDHLTT